jgi:hypothetical protein
VSGGAGTTGGISGAGGGGATPTFADVRAVFNARCGACHNGVGTAATRVKLDDIAAAAGSGGAGNSAGNGGAGNAAGSGGNAAGSGGVGGSGPTPLDDATLYNTLTTALVGTPTCAGDILVVPSNLASSFIITKLTSDTPGCGQRMPAGCTSTPSSCLTTDQLNTIQNWISGGAPH